ncbi:MAG: phosphate ABC transporter permease subunit PstC, partial [Desulfitobacterium sp.]|nr:phosphate ABC transporter permease subunit PstC [Desulfitobacterium sp.]
MNDKTMVRDLIRTNISQRKQISDKIMPTFFLFMALVSIMTTLGIILVLVTDASKFFSAVPLSEIFSTNLAPLSANPSFGILPLITGTIMTTIIAMLVAVPIGLAAAIYLSQFAPA